MDLPINLHFSKEVHGKARKGASVAAVLAMPAAGDISGQVIGVDGAMAALGFRYAPR